MLTMILLHGRGSSLTQFSGHLGSPTGPVSEAVQSLFPNVKWIFPSAKNSFSSLFEMELREWFDIWSLANVDAQWQCQLHDLGHSIRHARELIEKEVEGFERAEDSADGRIVLGGLSMGCATSLHVLLSLLADGKNEILAAFFGWCGWLSLRKIVEKAGTKGLKWMYRDLGLLENEDEYVDEDEYDNAGTKINQVPFALNHCTNDSVVEVRHGREM